MKEKLGVVKKNLLLTVMLSLSFLRHGITEHASFISMCNLRVG